MGAYYGRRAGQFRDVMQSVLCDDVDGNGGDVDGNGGDV